MAGGGGGKSSVLPVDKWGRALAGTGGGGNADLFPPTAGGGGGKSLEDPEENAFGVGLALEGTGGGGKDVWRPGGGFGGLLGRRPGIVGGVEGELGNRLPGIGGGPPVCELRGGVGLEEGMGGQWPLFMFGRPEGVSGGRGGAPPLGAGDLPPMGGIGGLAVQRHVHVKKSNSRQ